MSAARPFSIVCLSSQDWRVDLPTNRHQIMRRAAARGHRVLFVETGGFLGKHVAAALRGGPERGSLVQRLTATEEVVPGIAARKARNVLPWGQRSPLANRVNAAATARSLRRLVRSLPQPVVLWLYDPGAAGTIGRCGEAFAVYDCVDDYAEQVGDDPRRRALVRAGDERAAAASRVAFATTHDLQRRLALLNPSTHLVPNVGDFAHFSPAADRALAAADVRDLPRPVLGFHGNFLGSKVDLTLLRGLAERRPDATLLLVGPARDETDAELRALAALPNVRWVGGKPYDELPAYVAAFDVGLIPYVANDYTRNVFPLKLYEYLAAEKPVVATGVPELAGREPDVLLVEGIDAALAAVEAQLGRDAPEDRARRAAIAAANTWEARAERLLGLVAEALEGRA